MWTGFDLEANITYPGRCLGKVSFDLKIFPSLTSYPSFPLQKLLDPQFEHAISPDQQYLLSNGGEELKQIISLIPQQKNETC